MTKLAPQILFALILLLSQAELASHDAEHLGDGHGELCAAYAYQDHSADSPVVQSEPTIFSFQQSLAPVIANVVESTPGSAYASRAPPNTVFHS